MSNIRETAQRICAEIHKFTRKSGRNVDYVEIEINRAIVDSDLYHAVNTMICKLSAEGEIRPQDSKVEDVMDALHGLDGGVYRGR